jgi:hypothetical protein
MSSAPLKLVDIYRAAVCLEAVVAIDSVACGPAIVGVRMAPGRQHRGSFSD